MRKNSKNKLSAKFFSLILTLCMVIGLMPNVALAAEGDILINEKNFPDPVFRQYVHDCLQDYTNYDDVLSIYEREAVTEVIIPGGGWCCWNLGEIY